MITKKELMKRKWLSTGEMEELMENLGVNKMDLADECGITLSTLQVYWNDGIPKKHFDTIIPFFVSKCNGEVKTGRYTEEEIEFIRQNYLDMTDSEMADKLARTVGAIAAKRNDLGLTKSDTPSPKHTPGGNHEMYTKADDDFIRNNWKDLSDAKIAKELGRTEKAISCRRSLMGLSRDNIKNKKTEDITMDTQNPAVESPPPEPSLNGTPDHPGEFEHLKVERIIFTPKDNIPAALHEALNVSAEVKAAVYVRVNGHLASIKLEEQ